MSELKDKTKTVEEVCQSCEVFHKLLNSSQRTLACETARAIGACCFEKILVDAEAEISHKNHEIGGLKAEYSRMKKVMAYDLAELIIKVERFRKCLFDEWWSKASLQEAFVKLFGEKSKELLYPIHNHLETEPCTESCPNYRARREKNEG